MNHRYYPNEFPAPNDLVIVEIISIEEMGVHVILKEYNDLKGMILFEELSRLMVRSINKSIKVGQYDVALVVRIDVNKGYIDLSKKQIKKSDATRCELYYRKSKYVHNIAKQISQNTKISLSDIYSGFIWPLYKTYNHPYKAFKQGYDLFASCTLDPELFPLILKEINSQMQSENVC